MLEVDIPRRQTRVVYVKDVAIGGENPIVIQSMTTEKTTNIPAVVLQIAQLHSKGSEIVRLAVPTLRDAQVLGEVKAQLRKNYKDVPLVADIHHKGIDIALEAVKYVEKIRINPGLYVLPKRHEGIEYSALEIEEELAEIERSMKPVVIACRERGVAMRIGVNHGSLGNRINVMYGDTPEGIVQSALEYIEICERFNFRNLVISAKSSRVREMIRAYRHLANTLDQRGMNYPFHLGVTEAGGGNYAVIKSTQGISTLLAEGVGDTIRVSLTGDPLKELPVASDILEGLGLRQTKLELISCPSCGRTEFDIEKMSGLVEENFGHLVGLSVSVMGCVVNGKGEAKGVNYGVIGKAGGKVAICKDGVEVMLVDQSGTIAMLRKIIQDDGKWRDPE